MADTDLQAATRKLKDEVSTVGLNAVDAIDSGRGAAARGIQTTADGLRLTADALPSSPKVKDFTDGAVRMLDGTARYLRDTEPKDMLADVQTCAKAKPLAFMIAALAAGFLAGRILRRN